jgi:hypothetical protein
MRPVHRRLLIPLQQQTACYSNSWRVTVCTVSRIAALYAVYKQALSSRMLAVTALSVHETALAVNKELIYIEYY